MDFAEFNAGGAKDRNGPTLAQKEVRRIQRDFEQIAIVQAVTHWQDPAKLVEISRDLGEAMHGLEAGKLTPEEMLSRRGW